MVGGSRALRWGMDGFGTSRSKEWAELGSWVVSKNQGPILLLGALISSTTNMGP